MNRKCIFTTDKLPITCNGYGDFVQKCKREKRLRAGLVLLLRYVATRQGNNFTIAATHSPCDSNSPKYVGGYVRIFLKVRTAYVNNFETRWNAIKTCYSYRSLFKRVHANMDVTLNNYFENYTEGMPMRRTVVFFRKNAMIFQAVMANRSWNYLTNQFLYWFLVLIRCKKTHGHYQTSIRV